MKNLTEGNIYKTFILFAIPMVLSGVLSQAYNIIDTMIAGRYLGDIGLTEVGASAAFPSACAFGMCDICRPNMRSIFP